MTVLRQTLLLTGGALLLLWGGVRAAPVPVAQPERLALTVLHTNDVHGHMFPLAYTEEGRGPEERPSVGGAARRATLVRQIRSEVGHPVVLVDAGDTFTRGPLTTTYEGLADVEAMNAVGYEVAVVGNNEFKARDAHDREDAAGAQAALLRVVKRSRFPWVCANARDGRGALLEGVHPFVVREWQGVRVGFLGLTAPRSATYSQTKGWTIADPVAAAREWIPRARAECDVLIGLTHIGHDLDKRLVAETTGLDAIVGGDSHTFLYQAVEVPNREGRRVPIVQAGEFGVNLGRFDLRLARGADGWRLVGYDYALLPVGPELPEAPEVTAVLEPYFRPFAKIAGRVGRIGTNPAERQRLTAETIAAALLRAGGTDLALFDNGDSLFEVFRRPEVTRYDVYAAIPFHNDLVTAELSGGEIRALQAKVKGMVVAGAGAGLDDARKYRIVTLDFLARDTFQLPEERIKETGRDAREAVIEALGR